MFCQNCGQGFENNVGFCPNCGAKMKGEYPQSPLSQPVQPAQPVYNTGQYVPQQSFKPMKKKKRSGCLTSLLVLIGLLCAIALSAYFLLPGLFKPHDLGIKTSSKSYESSMKKLNFTKDKAPTTGEAEDYKYTYGKPQAVDTSLSSEELTSFFNTNRPDYYALKNVQIKINPDNTIEAAATLDVSYVFGNILDGKYSREDAQKALPMLGLLPNNINIYCKASGGIKDNKLNQLSIHNVSVMGIPIPESYVSSSDAKQFINTNIGGYLERVTAKSNTRFDLLQVNNGNLAIKGQIPSSISRIPVK